jgi:hypothetical protein
MSRARINGAQQGLVQSVIPVVITIQAGDTDSCSRGKDRQLLLNVDPVMYC